MSQLENIKSQSKFPITKIVQDWVNKNNWDDAVEIDEVKKTSTLKSIFDIKDESCTLYVEVDEVAPSLAIYLYNSLNVSEKYLNDAISVVNEINGELDVGRMYVEADGPFQYKHRLSFVNGSISIDFLENAVQDALQVFGKYQERIHHSIKKNERISTEILDECYEWREIDGSNKLKKWTNRLQHACANKTTLAHWKIIGKALILVNDSYEYCEKVLRTVAKEAGLSYIVVPKDEVVDKVSEYDFSQHYPVLVYLEPGRWKRDKWDSEDESDEEAKKYSDFRIKLKAVMSDFSPEKPVIFVTSTSDLDGAISNDIKHKGLFDLFISLEFILLFILLFIIIIE